MTHPQCHVQSLRWPYHNSMLPKVPSPTRPATAFPVIPDDCIERSQLPLWRRGPCSPLSFQACWHATMANQEEDQKDPTPGPGQILQRDTGLRTCLSCVPAATAVTKLQELSHPITGQHPPPLNSSATNRSLHGPTAVVAQS